MTCTHWFRTVEEMPYGWVSICKDCGYRDSGEHSPECAFEPCTCGATKKFQEYENNRFFENLRAEIEAKA